MHATPRFTVLSAELLHETNTFCALPTTLASFAERGLLHGEQAIAARQALNTELGGFLEAAREHGWAMVHTVSAHAQPGGRVTRQAFDELVAPILAAAQAQVHAGRLDGILLALHGAMVTETREDGEGELLARLRRVVGPRVPIAITLDPHANVTRQMCDLANIMVSFKTYPHTDMRVAGRHAADILQRTMAGEIKPRTLLGGTDVLGWRQVGDGFARGAKRHALIRRWHEAIGPVQSPIHRRTELVHQHHKRR